MDSQTEGEARDDLRRSWGEWLSRLAEWEYFVTLTFRDPVNKVNTTWTKPGLAYVKRAWNELISMLAPDSSRRVWVRCIETQKWRGVPHLHGLLSGCDSSVKPAELQAWTYKRYGISQIERYDSRLGAGWYLSKYAGQDQFDIEFGGDFRLLGED